jgi:hypothetical protein
MNHHKIEADGIWLWMLQKCEKWCESVPFCLLRSNFLQENHCTCDLRHGQSINLHYTCSMYVTLHPPKWVTILFWNDHLGWHMEYETVVKCHLVGLGVDVRIVLKWMLKNVLCVHYYELGAGTILLTQKCESVSGVLVILFPQSFPVILCMHFLWHPSSTTSPTHHNILCKSVSLV